MMRQILPPICTDYRQYLPSSLLASKPSPNAKISLDSHSICAGVSPVPILKFIEVAADL